MRARQQTGEQFRERRRAADQKIEACVGHDGQRLGRRMEAAAMRALPTETCACTFCQNAHIDAAQFFHHIFGVIVFWVLAIIVTAIACAALYYAAAGRAVNATAGPVDEATTAHYRLGLKEI